LENKSPSYELLELVWDQSHKSSMFSWRRLNQSMCEAMLLAIGSGMSFKKDDFSTMSKDFRMGYWGHAENFYTIAVTANNMSACHAIEEFLGRKPFIVKFPVEVASAYRQQGRIAVSTRFVWDNKWVTVTSFSEDGNALTACSYNVRKVEKRYKIKRQALKRKEL